MFPSCFRMSSSFYFHLICSIDFLLLLYSLVHIYIYNFLICQPWVSRNVGVLACESRLQSGSGSDEAFPLFFTREAVRNANSFSTWCTVDLIAFFRYTAIPWGQFQFVSSAPIFHRYSLNFSFHLLHLLKLGSCVVSLCAVSVALTKS